MINRERKEQQRQYVEQLLQSELSVAAWCKQYGVARQAMYVWLNTFAETEPELFGGKENIVDRTKRRWVESTRSKIAASKALALRPKSPGVIIVDTLFDEPVSARAPKTATGPQTEAISVELKGATIRVPPGSGADDISTVLKVVAAL